MTPWEKPSFEELAMNAEIGAYQPEYGDDERTDDPLARSATEERQASAAPFDRG